MIDIIVRPILTEKATKGNESGKYAFEVNKKVNKIEIKKAVEKMYGVNVLDVNTMLVRGKSKSRFTKAGVLKGKISNFKKAIVQVGKDDIIDFYSGL